MGLGSKLEHADRFAAYVNELTKVLWHADREKPFRDYCAGLLATEVRAPANHPEPGTVPTRVKVRRTSVSGPPLPTYALHKVGRLVSWGSSGVPLMLSA